MTVRAPEAAADIARVSAFGLLILWATAFFLIVYGVNVIDGSVQLWRQSRRLRRVLQEYGVALPTLIASSAFWLVLLVASGTRLYAASIPQTPLAGDTQVVAAVVPTVGLQADRISVGAYDPGGTLDSLQLPMHEWFVSQSDPITLGQDLATARQRGVIPLITIEPFPTGSASASVLQDVIDGRSDEQLAALAEQIARFQPSPLGSRDGPDGSLSGSGDDPRRYQAAFRHVVSVFDAHGVTNTKLGLVSIRKRGVGCVLSRSRHR